MSYSIDRGEKGYRVRSKRAKVGEEVFDGGFVPVPAFYSASYLIHSFIYSFHYIHVSYSFHSFIYLIHLFILFVAVHVEGRKVLATEAYDVDVLSRGGWRWHGTNFPMYAAISHALLFLFCMEKFIRLNLIPKIKLIGNNILG